MFSKPEEAPKNVQHIVFKQESNEIEFAK